MKVRVTLEVSDADRLIIGLKRQGKYIPATREEIVEEVEHAFDIHMHEPRKAYDEANEQIARAILGSLGK